MTAMMQSHGGQVRQSAEFRHGCDNYEGNAASGRYARRSFLRAAIFGSGAADETSPWSPRPPAARKALSGVVADVSPHVLILQTPAGEERLTLPPDVRAWRGSAVPAAALRHEDQVIVRKARIGCAERIWAQIGRVTGTIIEREGSELLVDEGPAKGRKIVLIGKGALRPILVRFPRMEPGYLIDVIGLRQEGYLLAMTPATAQPPYRADHPPAPPLVSGHIPEHINGTVSWHEPGEEPPGLLGLAYPALDPETNCEHTAPRPHEHFAVDPHAVGPGCVRLPQLSVGSTVKIHNECSGRGDVLPVTSCGAPSRLFCDRCVECGTSPRGRIADLTVMAFVELGGNLEKGCFNATLTVAK
jgi:hypothetical protein